MRILYLGRLSSTMQQTMKKLTLATCVGVSLLQKNHCRHTTPASTRSHTTVIAVIKALAEIHGYSVILKFMAMEVTAAIDVRPRSPAKRDLHCTLRTVVWLNMHMYAGTAGRNSRIMRLFRDMSRRCMNSLFAKYAAAYFPIKEP